MTLLRRCCLAVLVPIVSALLLAAPALGATHTWIGAAGGLWSNAANWSGGKPISGEGGGTIVQFGANTTSTMDIVGLSVDQIHFTGANNTISGSTTLTVNGSLLAQNVVSDAEGNKLNSSLPIAMTGASMEAVSAAGTLTIAGVLSGVVGFISAGDGGALSLTGQNTFTGQTAVLSGPMHIATGTGDVIVGSKLTIGSGIGPGAQLILDQSNDISSGTAVIVNKDGLINCQGFEDQAKSLAIEGGSVLTAGLKVAAALTMKGGTVTIGASNLSAGSLSMTGGKITATGPGLLSVAGNIQATPSEGVSPAVEAPLSLSASPTVTVNAGSAPDFRVTGPIGESGGSQSLIKTGAGTMQMGSANTYTGTTTVSAGTLIANGGGPGPFTVGENGTLTGSGTLGATSVAGVLTPLAPGFKTGALSFGATGRLDMTLTSAAPAALPTLAVTGTVSIEPSAALNLVVAPGAALPHGSTMPLIGNDLTDPISGAFAGIPSGFVLSTAEGVPLLVSYTGGDGNDLTLTAGNVPPQAGSIVATPNPVLAGQPVTLTVAGSDANQDVLTTSWNFGDGAGGTGPSTSHAWAAAGSYTVVATVSDGLAQAQSTAVVRVSAAPVVATTTTPHPPPPPPATAALSTVKSSAYGDQFAAIAPKACVRKGASFAATLSVKKLNGKVKGAALVKVTKVVFALGVRAVKTLRAAPYRALIRVPASAPSRSTVKVKATAYLQLTHAKHATKSVTVAAAVC